MTETTDRLTGLLTDDYLRSDLDMEFQRARRFNRDLSFILIEPVVDDATRADVAYTVLKAVARESTSKLRDIDIAVRWGQQVLIVLPETGRSGAETVEHKIRDSFGQLVFKHPEDGRDISVALRSIVLVFPHDGSDKETLLYLLRDRLQTSGDQSAAPST